MNIDTFKKQLRDFPVFSIHDIRLVDAGFHQFMLTRWQQKGHLQKLVRGYYRFTDHPLDEAFLYYAANKLYAPSYISVEMALSYYGLIPEATYGITSVSSRKTQTLNTPVGTFIYRNIKPKLLFGYQLVPYQKQHIRIAEMEKALLDFLYLNPSLKTAEAIEGIRLNKETLNEQLDPDKFNRYLQAFDSNALKKRASLLMAHLHADN